MKEIFDNKWQVFAYYRFLKCDVVSEATILPKENFTGGNISYGYDPTSVREEKLCFIADVEKLCHKYYSLQRGTRHIPLDCLHLIFVQTYSPETSRYRRREDLIKEFYRRKNKGENIPKRILYKGNLSSIAKDMLSLSESYFEGIGLIEPKEYEEVLK